MSLGATPVREALDSAVVALTAAGVETPRLDAEVLLAHVLGVDRTALVVDRDRAEKIRTYNYGERRVTDHRIGLTQHNLDAVLTGELDEFTAALQADERRRALQAQAEADAVR